MGPESVLTRRTLLSGGALFGLTGLLAACGQQANNEAAATTSAAPSETASASAAASESPSASATPSTVRGYSGGSKAPDGEYRKADAYGPAQNVPKPRNEPAQYPETEEGLSRMMEDWLAAHTTLFKREIVRQSSSMLKKLLKNIHFMNILKISTSVVVGLWTVWIPTKLRAT